KNTTCPKLTFRWPSWILLIDDGTTKPQTIKMDNDIDIFLSMKFDVANLTLCVTKKNTTGVAMELQTFSESASLSYQPQEATMIHKVYIIVNLTSSD
ncbi:hypothetical protein ISN44_As10g007260, partial [Arabidopsis suecica]